MEDSFYFRFEQKFRGTRKLILKRLSAYAPFLEAMAETHCSAKCIDLGCGRGEWLEILAEYGFVALGVDTDRSMIEVCESLNLQALHTDAKSALSDIESSSYAIVSGFHIAEHLDFEALQELFLEAHRVLMPGGIVIFETPNPENIQVSSLTFYLDPTHKKPIPPQLLDFLISESGFERTVISRLNHDPDLIGSDEPSIQDVLTGASPDYAVIGQKRPEKHKTVWADNAFESVSGITTNDLASRYQENLNSRLVETTSSIAEADIALNTLKQRVASAETSSIAAEQRAAAAEQRASVAEQSAFAAEQRASVAEDQAANAANQAEKAAVSANTAIVSQKAAAAELLAMRQSLSWRVTAPLRVTAEFAFFRPLRSARRIVNNFIASAIARYEKSLVSLIRLVRKNSLLSASFSRIIRNLPHLHNNLRQIYYKDQYSKGQFHPYESGASVEGGSVEMSRSTEKTYEDIKQLLNKENK